MHAIASYTKVIVLRDVRGNLIAAQRAMGEGEVREGGKAKLAQLQNFYAASSIEHKTGFVKT